MPLIQWIMQNLSTSSLQKYTGSGTILIYGEAATRFSENFYYRTVKFDLNSKGFDLLGTAWTVTGISAYSDAETVYTVQKGKTKSSFSDSQILVNQIPRDIISCLENILPDEEENFPTYDGMTTLNGLSNVASDFSFLEKRQSVLNKPLENLPTYEGIRKIRK